MSGLSPPFVTADNIVGGEFQGHAWIRDNVYSVLVIWGLSLAYKRKGEGETDRKRGAELEKVCQYTKGEEVTCMYCCIFSILDSDQADAEYITMHVETD